MEKHSDFGVGLDLTLNIYTISHTSMTESHHSAIVGIHIDDTILLEVFGWYRHIDQYLDMGYVGAPRTCAEYSDTSYLGCHSVAMPSGFVAPMYTWNIPEEVTGMLAILA